MNALSQDLPFDHSELVPPASLAEARSLRDGLAGLLAHERAAAADFLLALADFDRRRGWEALGHASLFGFLQRELRLSNGAAYLRLTAARLLPAHPAVEAALRDGRLCISAVGELSRVLTRENEAVVLPRFVGCSSREAREVAAALLPRAEPPRREVVTQLRAHEVHVPRGASQVTGAAALAAEERPAHIAPNASESATTALQAHEAAPAPAAPRNPPAEVEPLDADLRRLHLTVSRRLLDKVAAAKDALSHARPGASTEEVLEAALDLLLDQRARAKSLVKRPRPARVAARASPPPNLRSIPAEVERAVRLRDEHRCQWPLDAGGLCGSSHRVELDHLLPVAQGGQATVGNLRLLCDRHNRLAARLALGEAAAGTRRGPSLRTATTTDST
jgi:5-methylcytosine-specific restriction endonuclease McrA